MMVWACPGFHLHGRNRQKCLGLAAHTGIKNTRIQQGSHSSVPGRWQKTDVMHCNPSSSFPGGGRRSRSQEFKASFS